MQLSLSVLVIIFSLICVLDVARGTIFYVNPRAAVHGMGSLTSPWQTLAQAASQFQSTGMIKSGDIVRLYGGEHAISGLRITGNFTSAVTIEAVPGEIPQFSGNIYVDGTSFLVFRGLKALQIELRPRGSVNAQGIVIESCKLGVFPETVASWNNNITRYAAISTSGVYVYGSGCVNCIVRKNHIQYVRRGIITGPGMLIEDNIIEKTVGDGIRVASSDVTIRRNIVRSCLAVDSDHRDLLQVTNQITPLTFKYTTRVRNLLCYIY